MTTNDQAAMNEQLTQLRLQGLSIDGDNRYKQDLIDAVIGAMMFGAQGANPPPSGHWLEQFYVIGREERQALARVEAERRHDLQIQSAMAADQKSVADALGIPQGEYSGGAGEQLLAIEKLREALARAEADNRQLQLIVNSHANMRDTAQAQLAEAMGFLRFAYDHAEQHRPGSLPNEQKVRAFLAQDEQQEAKPQFPPRNPRSAKFQAALEETFRKFESMSHAELEAVVAAHIPKQEAQGAQAGNERAAFEQVHSKIVSGEIASARSIFSAGWQARAALATQPADGEPVAYAAFADNGSIQMWCKAGIDVARIFASTGKSPVPLYAAPPAAAHGDDFQARVQPWMLECFGEMIAGDREERNHRFLEEALELVQSTGCTVSEAHQLVDYVFGRPVGEPAQEVGGVMVTLAALCLANSLDMHDAAEVELARIWTKVEAIRAKQAAKPKHSPLPVAAAHGDEAVRKRVRQLEVLLDRCRDHVSQSMELMDDYDHAEEDAGIASELIEDIDAAMRAQGDGDLP